jgi:hypothetical protein
MKISEKKISFFSALNQYFPHIPYVASKNDFSAICKYSTTWIFSYSAKDQILGIKLLRFQVFKIVRFFKFQG